MTKAVKIKQSDVPKIEAWIVANVSPARRATARRVVEAALAAFTKIEQRYGFDLVLEVAEAVAPVRPPPQIDTEEPVRPKIISISHSGERMVRVMTEGCEGWPTKTVTKKDGSKKTTQGKLYIKGVYVDAMRPDQMKGAPKDLENAFGSDGEHSIDCRKGESLVAYIASFHGKKTEDFAWVWPFRDV